MEWIRDWVYRVIAPFLTQLKNRLLNIKIVNKLDGTILFTNSEGESNTVGKSNKDVMDAAITATISGALTLNPNPYFTNGDIDYAGYIAAYPTYASIVTDNVPNAAAALKIDGTERTLVGDTFCPMPESLEYRASVDVKAQKDGAAEDGSTITFYMGIVSYDSDKNAIYPQNIVYVTTAGSLAENGDPLIMELTRDLIDTNVYFTFKTGDITKIAHVDRGYFRVSKFHKKQSNGDYCYIGINGRVYDNLGMSKDMKYTAWAVLDDTKADDDPLKYIEATGQQVDGKDEYRLQLTSELVPQNAGVSYVIGDIWLQSTGGGTYAYWISSQPVPLDDKYHHFDSAWFKPTDYDGKNAYGRYRNGTAYVKLMMLPKYYYNDGSGNRYITDDDHISCYYGNIALLKRNI